MPCKDVACVCPGAFGASAELGAMQDTSNSDVKTICLPARRRVCDILLPRGRKTAMFSAFVGPSLR